VAASQSLSSRPATVYASWLVHRTHRQTDNWPDVGTNCSTQVLANFRFFSSLRTGHLMAEGKKLHQKGKRRAQVESLTPTTWLENPNSAPSKLQLANTNQIARRNSLGNHLAPIVVAPAA